MKQHSIISNSQGSALISALFIVALTVIIVAAVIVRTQLLIHDAGLIFRSDQVFAELSHAEMMGASQVEAYQSQWVTTPGVEPQIQIAPLMPVMKIPSTLGGDITTTLTSAQGAFNLNDMIFPQDARVFISLLHQVMPTLPMQQVVALAHAVTDYLTTGHENAYYAAQKPAYQASKTVFSDVSELRLVRGMTQPIYRALLPYITVLPIALANTQGDADASVLTSIDINAASPFVLMAINPGLSLTQAQSLVDCRKSHGAFYSIGLFMQECGVPSGVAQLQAITTQPEYFIIKSQYTADNAELVMQQYIRIKPDPSTGKQILTVLRQQFV